jgi:hypothetical protein
VCFSRFHDFTSLDIYIYRPALNFASSWTFGFWGGDGDGERRV